MLQEVSTTRRDGCQPKSAELGGGAPPRGNLVGILDFNAAAEPEEPLAALKARVDLVDLVRRYADLEQRHRREEWWGRCPFHGEKTPSFKVDAERQRFHCFGCQAHGDVFDFLERAENLDKAGAIARVRDLAGDAARAPKVSAAEREARRAVAAAREAREAATNKARALAILQESVPLTRRTAGADLALSYLMDRRGIRAWDPCTLRWHPACPWSQGTAGCIVVPVHDVAGYPKAIWRIRPALEGKVERRGLGPVKGGCARVVDASRPELVITEGVEDALAAWVITTYPAWAALSAGNLRELELPPEYRDILILADNDQPNDRGERVGLGAARDLARRLRAEGREVTVRLPVGQKDANDVLLARRAGR